MVPPKTTYFALFYLSYINNLLSRTSFIMFTTSKSYEIKCAWFLKGVVRIMIIVYGNKR
jgi:hypothetical protein